MQLHAFSPFEGNIHNIVDALGCVAVLVGAGAIIWLEWTWDDPAITLLIAGYVL